MEIITAKPEILKFIEKSEAKLGKVNLFILTTWEAINNILELRLTVSNGRPTLSNSKNTIIATINTTEEEKKVLQRYARNLRFWLSRRFPDIKIETNLW